jgi:hypothetical protein
VQVIARFRGSSRLAICDRRCPLPDDDSEDGPGSELHLAAADADVWLDGLRHLAG